MPWGHAGPRRDLTGVVKPCDVTDLDDEDRRAHRADPVDLLDRLIAGMPFEHASNPSIKTHDLVVIRFDQPSQ